MKLSLPLTMIIAFASETVGAAEVVTAFTKALVAEAESTEGTPGELSEDPLFGRTAEDWDETTFVPFISRAAIAATFSVFTYREKSFLKLSSLN